MSTKIEPVSKAAAYYFMNEVVHGEGNLYAFLSCHGFEGHADRKEDSPKFAEFLRAVADQLDPVEPKTLNSSMTKEEMYDGLAWEEIPRFLYYALERYEDERN